MLLTYSVVLFLGVQQRDSVIYIIYIIYVCVFFFIFFSIMVYYRVLNIIVSCAIQ